MSKKNKIKLRRTKSYSLELKQEILKRAKELGCVSTASREFGISPSTVHAWIHRCKKLGPDGLKNKSSRPNHQPKKTYQWIIDKILRKKKENPEMGNKAMSQYLTRHESIELSPNTISKIFKKHDLPDGDAGYSMNSYYVKKDDKRLVEQAVEAEIGEWQRFSRPNPNDLWQMDIMSFYIRDAYRMYLITAIDDCSRMVVNWGLFKEQTAANVLEVLRGSLMKHGAPKEILTDQGAQFKHWKGVTQFEKILKKLGIMHIKARSHHPQTCGKVESYHKTIHRELIDKEFFISGEQAVEKISRFVEHYNFARPHSSLNGYTPSDRYFGIIEAVKKYLNDFKQPKNETEEKEDRMVVGRSSKIYLIGKVLGQDVRIQELSGQISIHVNNQIFKEVNLLNSVTT